MKSLQIVLCTSIWATSILLTGCGGSSDNKTEVVSVLPTKPTTPTQPTTPAPTTKLLPESPLPALPNNDRPLSLGRDANAMQALQNGLYTTSVNTIITIGSNGNTYDCDGSKKDTSGQLVYCNVVTRFKYDANSKRMVSNNWIFEPNKNTWSIIELTDDKRNFYRPFYQDSEGVGSDGNQWFNDTLDLKNQSANLDNGALVYHLGQAQFLLTMIPTTLGGNTKNKVTFSNGAMTYNPQINLIQGQYINLEKRGIWKESDDGNAYASLADYRNAHTNKNSAVCFYPIDWSSGIVFNSSQTGAQLYKLSAGCKLPIDESQGSSSLAEGVKTINNRQVIYLSQKPDATSINADTSSVQFLWAIALNDKGIPSQGKAYQAGYAKRGDTDYFNRIAIADVLKAQNSKIDINNLPF